MRLNLIRKNSEFIEGYVNVDPYAKPAENIKQYHHDKLDFVDDAECDEIRVIDSVDFLSPSKIRVAVEHWRKKLRKGGKLTVGGADILKVALCLTRGAINEQKANELLYNINDAEWDIKQSAGSLETMTKLLEHLRFKVESKSIVNYRYIVTATKV